MTAGRRWAVVALGVLLLLAAPFVVRALPAADADVSATALLRQVQNSRGQAFSAYAETAGHVALPDDNELSSLSKLLGTTNQVRVWWAGPDAWRVASLRTTGETDLVHHGANTVRWVYESKNATLIPDAAVRLPQTADLLPHELARHVLAAAHRDELSRLPAQRVAGRDALGLRLTPHEKGSSVGHVDIYVDRATGVPLSVSLYGRHAQVPAVSTRFLDFTPGRPLASDVRFKAPPDAELRFDPFVDIASAVDHFAPWAPPTRLAGLPSRGVATGAVGLYGRGPTVLMALPLWSRTADRVAEDLAGQPGVQRLGRRLLVGAPPLRLLLGAPDQDGTRWVLAGTMTRAALLHAADQLAAHPPDFARAR